MFLEVNDMWYMHGLGAWGWLMMLVFWAVVVFLVVWTVRSVSAPRDDSPRSILDERLARGEIDLDDYEERRRVLDSRR